MSRGLRTSGAAKRLDLSGAGKGGGESRKMEIAMTGALVLIIIGAIVAIIYGLVGDSKTRGREKPREMHFQCIKCDHQFVLGVDELNKQIPDIVAEEAGALRVNCPECKAENAAWPASRCRKPQMG